MGQTEARLKEAQKLGLKEAVVAATAEQPGVKGLKVSGLETIMDLVGVVRRAGPWTAENRMRLTHLGCLSKLPLCA